MITTDRNYADPERLRTAASRRPNQLRHEADGDGDADAQPCFDQPHHSINPRLGAMLEEDDAAQVSGELGRVGQTQETTAKHRGRDAHTASASTSGHQGYVQLLRPSHFRVLASRFVFRFGSGFGRSGSWATEIERRARRALADESGGVPWDDVRRRADAELRQR